MDHRDPITEWSKTLGGSGESNRVVIEPDDAEALMGGQECRVVTSTAERGVDEDATGDGGEKRHDFIADHGNVFE